MGRFVLGWFLLFFLENVPPKIPKKCNKNRAVFQNLCYQINTVFDSVWRKNRGVPKTSHVPLNPLFVTNNPKTRVPPKKGSVQKGDFLSVVWNIHVTNANVVVPKPCTNLGPTCKKIKFFLLIFSATIGIGGEYRVFQRRISSIFYKK